MSLGRSRRYGYGDRPGAPGDTQPAHLRETERRDSGYLDLAAEDIGFTWVDREIRNRTPLPNTGKENPYGHFVLSATRFQPSNRRNDDLSETRRDDRLGATRRDDGFGATRRDDGFGATRRDDGFGATRRDDEFVTTRRDDGFGATRHNVFGATRRDDGFNATRRDDGLGVTRRDDGFGATRRDDGLGATRRDNVFGATRRDDGFNATRRDDGLGVTRRDDGFGATRRGDGFDATRQDNEFDANRRGGGFSAPRRDDAFGATRGDDGFGVTRQNKDNPYGHRVLGVTRFQPARTDGDMSATRQDDVIRETAYDVTASRRDEITTPVIGNGQHHQRTARSSRPGHLQPVLEYPDNPSSTRHTTSSTHHSGVGWMTMAANRELMGKWHGAFSQIKRQWSRMNGVSEPNHEPDWDRMAPSDQNSSAPSEYSDSKNKRALKKVIGLACILAIVVLAAVLVPVLLLTGKNKDKSTTFQQYDMELTIENLLFTPYLADPESDEYLQLGKEFCKQIDSKTGNKEEYVGCNVNDIRNGSVIVTFSVVLESEDAQLKNKDEMIVFVGLVATDSSDTTTLGMYEILVNTIDLINVYVISSGEIPIPKNVKYGGQCTMHAECVSILARCINTTCSCKQERIYNATSDNCDKINCGPLPSVPYAHVSSDGYEYGDTLTISCQDGYGISSNKNNETVQCVNNENWGNMVTCEPINCTEPGLAYPILLVDTNLRNKSLGSIVEVECKDGYYLNGSSVITCQTDGAWTEAPNCTAVGCGLYRANNHKYNNISAGYFMENVTIFCEEGFEYQDDNTTEECQADGNWTTTVQCVRKRCDNFTVPLNGNIQSENKPYYVYNDTLTLVCESGYKLDGSINETQQNTYDIICQADGNWSENPTCRRIECDNYVSDRYKHTNSTGRLYMDTITVYCEDGFEYKENNTFSEQCQADGNWTDVVICVRKPCSPLIVPLNGIILTGNNTNNFYNDTLTISCEYGYVFDEPESTADNETEGAIDVICQSDGNWSKVPTCRSVECEEYMFNNHKYANNTIGYFMDNTTVYCEYGFNYKNSSITSETCLGNGLWTHAVVCVGIKCAIFSLSLNAVIEAGNATHSVYNDTIMFSCKAGHRLSDVDSNEMYVIDGTATVLCLADGNWTEIPDCEPVSCAMYQANNNKLAENVSRTFMENITIECVKGYEYNDAAITTEVCQADSHWTSRVECVLVNCGPYNINETSAFTVENGTTIFNTTLMATCKPGLTPVEGTNMTVYCNAQGNWVGTPKCEIKGDVSFDEVNYQFEQGTIGTFTCNVVNAPDWQTINLVKYVPDSDPQIVATLDNSTGTVINMTNEYYEVNILISTENITVAVSINSVSCYDSGLFVCGIIVGDNNNPVALKTDNTSVNVRVNSSTPSLTLPSFIVEGQPTTEDLVCTGNVGYPPGRLIVQYFNDSTQTFIEFTHINYVTEPETTNCTMLVQSVTFSEISFTVDFNGTEFRCAVCDANCSMPNIYSDNVTLLLQ